MVPDKKLLSCAELLHVSRKQVTKLLELYSIRGLMYLSQILPLVLAPCWFELCVHVIVILWCVKLKIAREMLYRDQWNPLPSQ